MQRRFVVDTFDADGRLAMRAWFTTAREARLFAGTCRRAEWYALPASAA